MACSSAGTGAGAERTNAHVSTTPAAATPTSVHDDFATEYANEWSSLRVRKTALVTARPIAPARILFIASTPDAIPAFSPGIAAIAAADIGA